MICSFSKINSSSSLVLLKQSKPLVNNKSVIYLSWMILVFSSSLFKMKPIVLITYLCHNQHRSQDKSFCNLSISTLHLRLSFFFPEISESTKCFRNDVVVLDDCKLVLASLTLTQSKIKRVLPNFTKIKTILPPTEIRL